MAAIAGPGVATGHSPLRNPLRLFVSPEPWLALIFALLSFALGVFWFTVLVTLVSTGLSLVITFVGLPVLVGTMFLWIYGARLERLRVAALLGVRIPDPYRPLPAGSLWAQLKTRLADPHTWLDLLYLFLLFPIGIAEFCIAVTMVSAASGVVFVPLYYWTGSPLMFPNYYLDSVPKVLIAGIAGLASLAALPYVMVGLGRGHAWLASALLGPDREAALAARVDELAESRSRAMDASTLALQRIERDLHDGAQQRLVKLGMDLGLAREKLKTDPAAAEQLIAEAHEETKQVMAEIRDLARGIAPAVLTDRGLDAAISALAGRSPVPVSVDVVLLDRLPARVETTAYFVIAEALTNVARHSRATESYVFVKRDRGRLVIDVIDNGVGGALVAADGGLAGLRDRVAALDGTLAVSSPADGPTKVHVEIPCAS